jgi:hypothetical protein
MENCKINLNQVTGKSNSNIIKSDNNTDNNNIVKESIPPIYFIQFDKFKNKNEFPRFPNDKDITTNLEDINKSNTFFIFISHCWLGGWSESKEWRGYYYFILFFI